MAIDFLFSHSYFLKLDPKQWRLRMPYPPLGTLYAAALMREQGASVALFDTMFSDDPDEILPVLDAHAPRYLVIYDDGFNYLTKMCLTNMREAAFRMAEVARARGIRVIACSSDSTDHYEKYIRAGVEYVILGEGELTLKALVEHLEAGGDDPAGVAGLAYQKEGEIVQTPKRPVLRDLDSLPPPAWDILDIKPYQEAWSVHGYFSINMVTTRGCPYRCNWCAKPIYGNRYNSHSPAGKAEELAWLKKHFKADHVWFCDDIFGLKPGWVQSFAQEVEKRNLKTPFKIQSRVDLLMKDDTVAALARAGCQEVWLGAESGSQKILDAMDKGTTVDQIYAARKQLKKHKIRTAFFLQFGYLGETREDISATLKMLRDLLPEDIGISVSYPLPGTPFYEKVKDQLGNKANWTDSDELALMFRNNHSPAFYKRLHRYVHKHFRKWQGQESLKQVLTTPFNSSREEWRKALSTAYYLPAAFWEGVRLKQISD